MYIYVKAGKPLAVRTYPGFSGRSNRGILKNA